MMTREEFDNIKKGDKIWKYRDGSPLDGYLVCRVERICNGDPVVYIRGGQYTYEDLCDNFRVGLSKDPARLVWDALEVGDVLEIKTPSGYPYEVEVSSINVRNNERHITFIDVSTWVCSMEETNKTLTYEEFKKVFYIEPKPTHQMAYLTPYTSENKDKPIKRFDFVGGDEDKPKGLYLPSFTATDLLGTNVPKDNSINWSAKDRKTKTMKKKKVAKGHVYKPDRGNADKRICLLCFYGLNHHYEMGLLFLSKWDVLDILLQLGLAEDKAGLRKAAKVAGVKYKKAKKYLSQF